MKRWKKGKRCCFENQKRICLLDWNLQL